MHTLGCRRSRSQRGESAAQRPATARLPVIDITAALRRILRVRAARQAAGTEHRRTLLRTLTALTAARAARRAARGSSGATGISSAADVAPRPSSAGSAGISPARQPSHLTRAALQLNAFVTALVGVDIALVVTQVATAILKTLIRIALPRKNGRLAVFRIDRDTRYDALLNVRFAYKGILWPCSILLMSVIGLIVA